MIREAPALSVSPSFNSFLSSLRLIKEYSTNHVNSERMEQQQAIFREAVPAIIATVLSQPATPGKTQAIHGLVLLLNATDQRGIQLDSGLEEYLVNSFHAAMEGSDQEWDLISDALRHDGELIYL